MEILYSQKVTGKQKQRLTFFLQKSKKLLEHYEYETQRQAVADMRGFVRYYEFLLQISSFEDTDLHKKYNFISYLLAYINIKHPGGGFNLDGKIKASQFVQKKGEEHVSSDLVAKPVMKLPTTEHFGLSEDKEKRLSEIIDEINSKTLSSLILMILMMHISYVVSGVGFLGAGVIMKEGMNVRGLNTAATLWCSAAVGSCTGADMLAEGVLLTVLIIAGNTLLRPLVNAINRIPINEAATEATYEVRLSVDAEAVPRVRERLVDALEAAQYPVGDVQVVEHADAPTDVIAVLVSTAVSADELDLVLARMEHVPGVLQLAYSSPKHIGVRPVLHRLLVPRHPPCALSNLTVKKNHYVISCVTN
ncbi:MgtC/SapB family protein [Bacillus paralicheniformis]|uniref:MgtC/SapB family protein n=2 Tax=Bacteria TaxID=2 RepID=UPI001CC76479|nr:MgtC/SapB family protein [Bacillus paralicheniformis]